MQGTLFITGDAAADQLLNTDPLARLIGMLLDLTMPISSAQSTVNMMAQQRLALYLR